jgi:hypothetical protein
LLRDIDFIAVIDEARRKCNKKGPAIKRELRVEIILDI